MFDLKILWRLGIFLVLLGFLSACQDRRTEDPEKLADASSGLSSRMAELKNELLENPKNAEARYLLGRLNLQLGAAIAAEKEFRRALQYGWDRQKVLPLLGEALLPQRRYLQVLDEINVENGYSAPVRAQISGIRGQAELGLDRPRSAAKSLQAGLDADPDSIAVLLGSMGIYKLEGDTGSFATTLARAQERHPENRQLLLWQGFSALRQEEFAEAEAAFRRVLDLEPSGLSTRWGRQARHWLVQVHIHTHEFGLADEHIEQLLRLDPDASLANYLGAIVAFEQGAYPLARNHLVKVMERHADLRSGRLLLGASFYAQENYEQAAQNLGRYLVHSPENRWAHKLLLKTHLRLGEYEQAGSALLDWRKSDPGNADVAQLLALHALQADDPRLAMRRLEEIAQQDTDTRQLQLSAYFMAGDSARAFAEGAALSGDSSMHGEYGEILDLLRKKDWDAALDSLQQRARNPSHRVWALSLAGSIQVAYLGSKKEGLAHFREALMAHAFDAEGSEALSNPAELLPDQPLSEVLGKQPATDLQGIYRQVGSWEEITSGIGANSPYTYSFFAENPFSQWMRDDGIFTVAAMGSGNEEQAGEEGVFHLIEKPIILLDAEIPPLTVLFALIVIIGLRLIAGMRK